ncbi:MAG: TrbC/VirB2 family protein [Janthinobacterium lividum]
MNFLNFQFEIDRDFAWRLLLTLCLISVVTISSDYAFADDTTNDVIGNTLCRLVSNLSGGIARAIAALAIFSVGVGLFLGKLNWGIAAATAAGVGIIFSAPKLVAFLSGDTADATCTTTTTS